MCVHSQHSDDGHGSPKRPTGRQCLTISITIIMTDLAISTHDAVLCMTIGPAVVVVVSFLTSILHDKLGRVK